MISLVVRLRQKSLKSFLGGSRVSIMLLEFPLWTVIFIASFFFDIPSNFWNKLESSWSPRKEMFLQWWKQRYNFWIDSHMYYFSFFSRTDDNFWIHPLCFELIKHYDKHSGCLCLSGATFFRIYCNCHLPPD